MELSPTDIRNHQFGSQMRGYDKAEVDTFKEQVAQTLEHCKQDLMRVTMELEATRLQFAGIKQFEDTIKGAAIDARRNADATIATARKEAELILQKTKSEVETLISTRRQRIAEVESQLERVELIRKAFLQKIRAMINSHLELVEAGANSEPAPLHQKPPQDTPRYPSPTPKSPASDADDIEITDSTEVRRTRRETVATPPSKPEHGTTEEANAPSHIVSVVTPTDPVAASLQKAIRGDEPPRDTIDPELASALEKYQRHQTQQPATPNQKDFSPVLDEIVEATNRLEETPLGLVGNNQDEVADTKASAQTGAVVPPEVLARELDEVVARFAEEMDKAAKS
jgi:DivIVA domain-containing protein